MTETLETLKIEYPELPSKTGYSRRSDLQRTWANLQQTIDQKIHKPFNEEVAEFSKLVGLPAPESKPKRRESVRNDERKHHHHRH